MRSFTYNVQLGDGPRFETWDQVHAEGELMQWLLTGDVSLFLAENYHEVHRWMTIGLFMSLTQVCAFLLYHLDSPQV
jgi:hypothetical protein